MSHIIQTLIAGKKNYLRQTSDMKKIILPLATLLIANIGMTLPAWSSGARGSAGLSLVTEGSARFSALGTAGTAVLDDAASLAYNPAAPASLSEGQASFLFQRGLIEDSYGQLMLGMPNANRDGGFGLVVGYYNAGTLELAQENGKTSSVKAQEDLTASLGYAHQIGRVSLGLAGKFIRSTLAEKYSAQAMALDLGLLAKVSSRLSLGVSALNYGTKLTYLSEGDDLQKTIRGGGSYLLFPSRTFSTSLLFDASYLSNEKQLSPALGLETLVGPLAIRAGYRKMGTTGEFSAGAGFALGRSSIDYAFGLLSQSQVGPQHKVSFAMHFGPSAISAPTVIVRTIEQPRVQKPVIVKQKTVKEQPVKEQPVQEEAAPVARVQRTVKEVPVRAHSLGGDQILRAPRQQRRVYVVQENDTLASIAQDELGDKRQWKTIYSANQHLIDDPASSKWECES